jgi:hypothetical protein
MERAYRIIFCFSSTEKPSHRFRAYVTLVALGLTLSTAAEGVPTSRRSDYHNDMALQCGPGVLNVRDLGANASVRSTRAKTITGSDSIQVVGLEDFKVGQTVALLHAGPPVAVRTPAGLIVESMTYDKNGTVTQLGCKTDKANSSCSVSWTWQVVSVDPKGGSSVPTAPATIANGPTTSNVTNRIRLYWDSDPKASGYLVYGCSGTGCRPQLKAVLPNNWYRRVEACPTCPRSQYMVYWYMGHRFGTDEILGTALPAAAQNEHLFTRIRAIGGTTVKLAAAPDLSSASIRLIHDDSPAFQAAINRAKGNANTPKSNGGEIFIPPGQYPIAQTIDFYRSSNIHLYGGGGEGSANMTQLVWRGAAGGTVFSLNQARDLLFENFAVTDSDGEIGGSTPGVILDIDKYDTGEGIAFITTHDRFRNLGLQRSGIAVRIANRSDSNCEMMRFDDVIIDSAWNGQGGWYGYYIAGAWETYDEQINGGSVASRDAALYLDGAGSVDAYALDLSHNLIDWYLNDVSDHIIETGSDSELAGQHLYVSFGSGTGIRMTIRDSRLVDTSDHLASHGYYIVDNASRGLELAGDDIFAGSENTDKVFFSANGAAAPAELVSVSNFYGDPKPFAVPEGAKSHLISVLDRTCIDSGCDQGGLSPYTNKSAESLGRVFRPPSERIKQAPW